MKVICILSFVIIATAYAGGQIICKKDNFPVCGQPLMPPCPSGLACIQLMPAPKTYLNRCDMKKDKADFISDGPCEGRFVPCLDGQEWDAKQGKCNASNSVQIANPASVNCGKLGGFSEIITTKSGQYSNCAIEKTLLFSAMKGRGLVKLSEKVADQASANCIAIKGTLRTAMPQTEPDVCVIEEWNLIKVINVTSENHK